MAKSYKKLWALTYANRAVKNVEQAAGEVNTNQLKINWFLAT